MEFQAWPSTPRLFRECTITEKIDGTNAAVVVDPETGHVSAQSRKRVITPTDDNYGFARWVGDNAEALAESLGPGYHFGEWYGQGIQRRYGLGHKRFALFNSDRWAHLADEGPLGFLPAPVPGLGVVPVLYEGPFTTDAVKRELAFLSMDGSRAVPGFMRPEGVVVYHHASRQKYKALIENDDVPKSLAGSA